MGMALMALTSSSTFLSAPTVSVLSQGRITGSYQSASLDASKVNFCCKTRSSAGLMSANNKSSNDQTRECSGQLENGFMFAAARVSRAGKRQSRQQQPVMASIGSHHVVCALKTKPVRKPAEELSGPDLDSWQAVVGRVQGLGFDDDEAGKIVGRAFGWIFRSYWDDKMEDVVPNLEEVEKVLSYLTELGLEQEELKKVVKGFPYVLACDVEKRLKINVEQLDREWSISGPALKRSILRKPIMLGYSVDCRGDCISECDHCWARF